MNGSDIIKSNLAQNTVPGTKSKTIFFSVFSEWETLFFCNTVASCRAVEYAINQDAVIGGSFSDNDNMNRVGEDDLGVDGNIIHAISYHGDLNSIERETNLQLFRNGMLWCGRLVFI